MERNQVKELIAQRVRELNGVKNTALASDKILVRACMQTDLDLPELMEEVVLEGEIVEVQYVLPDMDYRIKIFYLPKGTEILP